MDNWLRVLFFEAFNNKFHGGHNYFPTEIKEALSLAPYLNGGLFTENRFDQEYKAAVSDRRFEQILKFLERYNFTIAEDSPLDKEVAVDPEMIGKVYESLVNVSDEIDERGEAGIFFTPRTEIDLMCRLSLVDNLANHIGQDKKSLLYQLVFALEPDEKTDADKAVADAGLWQAIDERLHEITVLDPACGSGSFLVGILNILDDLQERANRQLNKTEAPYERKKRIIGQTLYGVDVMGWACHTAELRLWLALIIDAEIPQAELHVRQEPLLPHFTFKIRYGDSLVQEIGGVNFGHKHETLSWSKELKKRIDTLKDEKLKFYNNDKTCQFRSLEEVKQEERNIFQGLLEYRIHTLENDIKTLNQRIATPQTQLGMIGLPQKALQAPLDVQNWKRERDQKQEELAQSNIALKTLHNSPQIPFVWDIAFVEIFESEKEGFDIVIGNPPYVRQEAIAAPAVNGVQITPDKKDYKAKLAFSVYQAFPNFFGYNANNNTVVHKIDAKSDLYIYFYLHGLSLLNPKGSFCFITSNSWLDVGYGADLQEFLLKHSHVKLVLDNQVKRSFANAAINSVIALFSAPDDRREWALEKTSRFVMFRAPFEHILSPVIFEEIEEATERKACKEYRIFPITQSKLLEDGCEIPEEEESGKTTGPLIKVARYIGNKWGGKYLRAPDIYWTILEKGAGILKPLNSIKEVTYGIKTGANEFFYLDEERIKNWGIENKYLKPVVKSPKECKQIRISGKALQFRLFVCLEGKKELRGTSALEYIKWGESQKHNENASVRGRNCWWHSPYVTGNAVFVKEANDSSAVFYNPTHYPIDCRLYCANLPDISFLFLNSPIAAMMFEIYNRAGLGQGARSLMVSDYASVPCLADANIEVDTQKIIEEVSLLPPRKFRKVRDAAWSHLDDAIFEALSLTQDERDAVYEAVIGLVEARLSKAGSL